MLSMSTDIPARLSHADLLQLKRWNTPTVYNGWEQVTQRDAAAANLAATLVNKEPHNAFTWAHQISDPAQRAKSGW